jgi:hypothetical protein
MCDFFRKFWPFEKEAVQNYKRVKVKFLVVSSDSKYLYVCCEIEISIEGEGWQGGKFVTKCYNVKTGRLIKFYRGLSKMGGISSLILVD